MRRKTKIIMRKRREGNNGIRTDIKENYAKRL